MNKHHLIIIFYSVFFLSCSASQEYIKYDREIKKFNFDIPARKVSLGLLMFSDGRSDFERLGEDIVPKKKSLRLNATKIAEDILNKHGIFSSVSVIQSFELPDFNNQTEVNRFLKNRDIDYILISEILEAKVIKIDKKIDTTKKIRNVFDFGALGEDFEYIGKARVRGKLFSIQEKKVIWEGQGASNFRPSSKFANMDTKLSGALYNAIGTMLKNMSSVFGLKIKEVQ